MVPYAKPNRRIQNRESHAKPPKWVSNYLPGAERPECGNSWQKRLDQRLVIKPGQLLDASFPNHVISNSRGDMAGGLRISGLELATTLREPIETEGLSSHLNPPLLTFV
jgi:hypothetical protein